MNITEFFKRWREGIKNLSPKRQLSSKLIGQIGLTLALCAALINFAYRLNYFYVAILVFIIFLQIINIIGTRQQYIAVLKMEETLGNPEQEEEGDKK